MPIASLTRTRDLRVYDISAGGCLLESRELLPVGTIGLLSMEFEGRVREEWIRICRVQAGDSRRGRFVASAEFLPLEPAAATSVRHAMLHLSAAASSSFRELPGRSSGDPGNSPRPASEHSAAPHADRNDSNTSCDAIDLAMPLLNDPMRARSRPDKGVVDMKSVLLRLVRNDEGQDLIEYVLIGTLVSIAVVIGAGALGTNLNLWYQALADWVGRRDAQVPAT